MILLNETLKRAGSVFQENPEIKQRLYYLRLVPGHRQSSGTFCRNVLFFLRALARGGLYIGEEQQKLGWGQYFDPLIFL